MKEHRMQRRTLLAGATAAGLAMATGGSWAQSAWPNKPVNLVVPFPAAGNTGAHHRHAHFGHDRAHVGEVDIDQARTGDQVGDALHRAEQHVIGRLEPQASARRLGLPVVRALS